MAIYKNKVEWRGEHLGYTWCRTARRWSSPRPRTCSGKPEVLTPEDAFVAAANTCYHMMVVWACERFKMDLVSLEMRSRRRGRGAYRPDLLVQDRDLLSQELW